MGAKRIFRIALSLGLAAATTASFYLVDRQRQGVHETISALRWARQVASQAEGMALRARETGESDPIGFAVNYLAQGVEPRLIKVSRYQGLPADLQTPELFHLDRESESFDYTKIINSDELTGVRVEISVGYTGFLGAKSKLTNDLGAVAVFAALFLILFLASALLWDRNGDPRIRQLVEGWSSDSKGNLTQLGVHIREMVRQAQCLAVASNRSHATIASLREKIHARINGARESRQQLKEADKLASQAEGLALSAVIEANRIGPEGKRLAEMAQNLHQLIYRFQELSRQSGASVQELERELEPWATDADIAFHAYDEATRATAEMQAYIRKTTETVLGQAKLLQRLNRELAEDGAQAAAPKAPAVPKAPDIASSDMPAPLPELGGETAPSPKKRASRKRSPKKAA